MTTSEKTGSPQTLEEIKKNLNNIRRYCMKQYGWTIKEVDEAPYERLMELIIEKETEKKGEVMSADEFIRTLS